MGYLHKTFLLSDMKLLILFVLTASLATSVLGGKIYSSKEASNDFLGNRVRRSRKNGQVNENKKETGSSKQVETMTQQSCLDSDDFAIQCLGTDSLGNDNLQKIALKNLKRGDFVLSADKE